MRIFYKFIFIYCITSCFLPNANAILLMKPDTMLAPIQAIDAGLPMVQPKADEFMSKKNQTVGFVLAIVLGWLGIHDFYAEKMTNCAIKFLLGTLGLFFTFFIPPLGITLLLISTAWALYDAFRIYIGEYQPEEGSWDVTM